MSQWWQTGLAIILCCVKLMEGYVFMTCATFHAMLPWESNVCTGAADRNSDIYLELILWSTGQSDLTVPHHACSQAASHEFLPSLAPRWPSVRLGTFWKCCCCSGVTLHPCGDMVKALAFLSQYSFPGLYACMCWGRNQDGREALSYFSRISWATDRSQNPVTVYPVTLFLRPDKSVKLLLLV